MTDEQIERNLVEFTDSLAEGTMISGLMISVISYIDKLKDEIAGLTGAVEALKTDNANLTRTLEECNEELNSVRKETAKEIFLELFSKKDFVIINGVQSIPFVEMFLIEQLSKKYGVEVEE